MPAKFHQNPRFGKFSVKFYRNSTYRTFPNFSSSSLSNLEKFLLGKLFLTSCSTRTRTILTERGIEVNPDKISAIARMGSVKNIKDIQ
jgi:hypothetical protein